MGRGAIDDEGSNTSLDCKSVSYVALMVTEKDWSRLTDIDSEI